MFLQIVHGFLNGCILTRDETDLSRRDLPTDPIFG